MFIYDDRGIVIKRQPMTGRAHKKFLPGNLNIRHILLVGLLFRLIAVVFSKGYAFHDDHFEMAELVQRWKDGYSFLWTGSDVHVFSLVYPGFLYLLFDACHAVGLHSPEQILFVTRLVHALFSLLSVWYSYKLVQRVAGNEEVSLIAALVMAIFWIFPFMAVRNLREFVCIPFLLGGSYYIADPLKRYSSVFIAALLFALAFTIRLQTLFIPFGIGLVMLFEKKQLKTAIAFGVFLLIGFMITQGLFDLIYYKDPLASVREYLRFNSDEANIVIQPRGPWYLYFGTLAGVFLGFPFLLLLFGFINSWKLKPARMFLAGSLVFLIFHSYYSNKQERFILPLIPFFIILGLIGFFDYSQTHQEKKFRRIVKFVMIWFMVFNTIGLFILSFTYSKKARVESMLYLREKGDVSNIIMEAVSESPRPPLFYLGKEINFYTLNSTDSVPKLTLYIPGGPNPSPNYVIMSGNTNLAERVNRLKKLYPLLMYETSVAPGFIDNIAYRLNPKHNDNESWYIYKIR